MFFRNTLLYKQALRYLEFFSCISMRFSVGRRVAHQRMIAKYFAQIHTMKMAIITVLEGLRIFMSINPSLANNSFFILEHKKKQLQ